MATRKQIKAKRARRREHQRFTRSSAKILIEATEEHASSLKGPRLPTITERKRRRIEVKEARRANRSHR